MNLKNKKMIKSINETENEKVWIGQVIKTMSENDTLKQSKINVSIISGGVYVQNTMTLFSVFILGEKNNGNVYFGDAFSIKSPSRIPNKDIIPESGGFKDINNLVSNISNYLNNTDFSVVKRLGYIK